MAPPPQTPELIEELVEEVLLRFPPDDPASLVRAALVCKLWCRLVSGTAFRRRFREFHRGAAPLLGALYTAVDCPKQARLRDDDTHTPRADTYRPVKRARIQREPTACFVPTTSYRPADGGRNGWRAIDAHHGRVLLCRNDPSRRRLALSVWDPITAERRDLPEAPFLHALGYSAAVACAAAAAGGDGNCCDHLDCHRGPFLVVAMDVQPHIIVFSVYSSEAGAWSNPTVLEHPNPGSLGLMKHTPGVLIGTALYFLVHFNNEVVEYDLATQEVSTTNLPSEFRGLMEQRSIVLMTGDDGELGFVANTKYQLELWSMVVAGGDASFVLRRVIDLQKVLPSGALINNNSLQVSGFADGGASRFLFMRTSDGLYSIEINSSRVRKVSNHCSDDDDDDDDVVPYICFCTPTSRVKVQEYNFLASDSVGASPDARPTTATVANSEDDGLHKTVPGRLRTKNPRFYGSEWANS